MSRKGFAVVTFMIFALALVSRVALRARAQENKTPYPSMAQGSRQHGKFQSGPKN